MEDELFIRPSEIPIIICKKCVYVVRPKEIIGHLRGTQHRLPLRIATQISNTIYSWESSQDCDQWIAPFTIPKAIPGLPIYTNGIRCVQSHQCQFVARTARTIDSHWRTVHHWSALHSAGRGRRQERYIVEQDFQQATIMVSCQRAFTQGPGSHYIHVQSPNSSAIDIEAPAQPQAISQLIAQLEEAFTEQQVQRTVIEAGERDEANPWLRRTQWAVYLAGLDPEQLIQSVQRPAEPSSNTDSEPGSEASSEADSEASSETSSEADSYNERAARAIWDSMAAVARVSQRVSSSAGHMIRIEAVRNERDQAPHTPLQAYMDEENIVRHAIPWQQVLMFFVRTQTRHSWQSPRYRFTERQRKAWQALWRLARADRRPWDYVSGGYPDPQRAE